MASKATTSSSTSAFTPNLEEATERIRELNEKLIAAAKQSGDLSLGVYEKTLQSLVDFEQKAAGASQLEWVQALAKAHADFVTEVSSAFTQAARDALK